MAECEKGISVHSRNEARHLIEEIHRKYTPTGHDELAELLGDALEMLSKELYDTSTRFLVELLQNADDNAYDCPDPAVEFTYTPKSLVVYCNERGFTAENVKALCSIRRSTKTELKHIKRFIGEKGIGFKSVFKVADVVHVSSREYHFAFDKRKPFGIIAPVWKDFQTEDSHAESHGTSFRLSLSDDCNEEELVESLRAFDPDLMVFLNQMRDIVINIVPRHEQAQIFRIHRTDTTDQNGNSIIVIDAQSYQRRYLIRRHLVKKLPVETKRPGISQSELVLAFPIHDLPTKPQCSSYNVYAFLPVADHGLKFLLQGDFLLTASRLNIDESSSWNHTLRVELADAFFETIQQFNGNEMRYFWPYYVPFTSSPYFRSVSDSILRRLKDALVLESCAGDFTMPHMLSYVETSKISEEDGQPFMASPTTRHRYLSMKYPAWVIESISLLGVEPLSDAEFLSDLEQMILNEEDVFRSKSFKWQNELAKALIPLTTDEEFKERLSRLPVIPLLDGTWTSADSHPALPSQEFCRPEFKLVIPHSIVHAGAASDEHRVHLFERLGIERIKEKDMCRFICDNHASAEFSPYGHSRAQLISQMIFLHHHSWKPSQDAEFWFATQDDGRCLASRSYIRDSPGEGSEIRVLDTLEKKFPIIHEDYLAVNDFPTLFDPLTYNILPLNCLFDPELFILTFYKGWVSFLTETLGLSRIPRLVYPPPKGSDKAPSLSEEFKYLFRECSVSDVLHFININWQTYGRWIEQDVAKPAMSEVAREIGNLIVDTSIGPARLADSVFPKLDALIEDEVGLPILRIHKAKDKNLRKRLSCLGIMVDNDFQYYIACLRSLKDKLQLPDKETVAHIYEQIQFHYDENWEQVEDAIDEYEFIYVAAPVVPDNKAVKTKRWYDRDGCMKKKINVETEYPRSNRLFRCMLSVDGIQTDALIAKATSITSSTKLKEIFELFSEISNDLQIYSPKRASKAVKPLMNLAIFPTTSKNGGINFDRCRSIQDTAWFIPDRAHLRESFAGKVPLFSFDERAIEAMEHFLAALGLDSKRLSKAVEKIRSPQGPLVLSHSATSFLRKRATFIAALIDKSTPERSSLADQLKRATVSIASRVTYTYSLMYNGVRCQGKEKEGKAALSSKEILQLFIAEKAVSHRSPPVEIVDLLAEYLKIQNPLHLRLLFTVFSQRHIGDIKAAFDMHGIHVQIFIDTEDEPRKLKTGPKRRSGDISRVTPSLADWDASSCSESESKGGPFNVRLQRRKKKADSARDKDRRAPLMNIIDIDLPDTDGYGQPRNAWKLCNIPEEFDPYLHLQYMGECLTSTVLSACLNGQYHPKLHWTSPLRTRAGYPYTPYNEYKSPFTIANPLSSQAMTEFLIKTGQEIALNWRGRVPTYHIELAVSSGERSSSFVWDGSQLEMMRRFRLDRSNPSLAPKNVVVLFRISEAFRKPNVQIFVDPWQLFASGYVQIQPDDYFSAVMDYEIGLSSLAPHVNQHSSGEGGGWDETMPRVLHSSNNFGPVPGSFSSPAVYHYGPSHSVMDIPNSPYYIEPLLGPKVSFEPRMIRYVPGANSLSNPYYQTFKLPEEGLYTGHDIEYGNHISQSTLINTFTGTHDQVMAIVNDEWTEFPYTYRNLNDEIRLFVLFPGAVTERLCGTVYTLPLDHDIPYRAVSYLWGSDDQPIHPVVTPDGTIMVRESLFAALRRLRHKTIELVLWIDAICINQDDMVEKAQQIRLLPRIYQNASCTLAFLGAEDTTNDAVKVLLQVQAVKLCGQDSEDIPKELRPIPAAWGANGIPALNDHIWADVAKFFRNPWFRRAWIVQEAVLAPTLKIVSGKWMIDWDDLTGSMEVIDYKLQATHIDTKSWAPFLTLMKAREREVDARHGRLYLFDLLESFRHLDSTLKRDRYFAFLGIAEDGNKVDFDPDYDMPLESITKRIARGILQDLVAEKQGMKMLCRAGLSLQADRFPSWAPNWTVSSPKSLSDSEDRGVTFCSSGTRDERIDLSAGGDTIDIEGYFVDTVNQVSKSANYPDQLRRYFKEIEKMLDSVPEGKIAINTKWKVPIAAALHPTYASSTDTDIESSYNALQKMLTQANHGKEIMKEYFRNLSSESMTPSPFENEGTNLCAKSKNYTSLLGGAVAGWRFITTQRGLCGIASNLVRAGDRVCVFSGGSVPFIVRVSDTRDGMFRLVGESYVDGIMYGEALGFSDVTASMISLH